MRTSLTWTIVPLRGRTSSPFFFCRLFLLLLWNHVNEARLSFTTAFTTVTDDVGVVEGKAQEREQVV